MFLERSAEHPILQTERKVAFPTADFPSFAEQSYTDIQRCEYWFHESDTTHAALIRFASDRLSPVPIADAEFWPFRSYISSHIKNPWKPVYGILRVFKDSG